MEIYAVGGAVRDELLGLPVKDRDYVVVGATPDQMLAAGFRPVGKDFPVFLHPRTQEEYALARTERKTAPGYKGFLFHADPTVTLEQDLQRRDLTVNAMARAGDGRLIDPWGGQQDLAARVLRHVSPAFAEDPVRILRVARFAARFGEFRVADETLALCRGMVRAGEVDALVPERVWQEIARGLETAAPHRMFEVLADCGALARLLPELVRCLSGATLRAPLERAAAERLAVGSRWACLWVPACAGGPAAARAASERLKAPADCRDLAVLAAAEAGRLSDAAPADAEAFVALFERCDAWRRPARFEDLLAVAVASAPGLAAWRQACDEALAAARRVDAGAVARGAAEPARIPALVRQARIAAVERCLAR